MIRIRKKEAAAIPAILTTRGNKEIIFLQERYNAGEREFKSEDFRSTIYGHDDVKNVLIEIQDYKCCFCESKIGHISYGDVEHFRPKAGWVQDDEKINKPGYYWLAYNWNNLLLSCQICNQRHKKNYFPLLNNSPRAVCHNDDIQTELPIFINPDIEDAETFITFNEEIPTAVNDNQRGEQTINKLGLDRELLNEQRRRTLNMIRDIYDLAKGYPDTNKELKQRANSKIQKYYDESFLDEAEYSSMLRAFFKKNPL
jgi:uncharacterized protein (TIGR02646 family)